MNQPGQNPLPRNPNLGRTYSGIYELLGRRVPLPAGEFEVMGYIPGRSGAQNNVDVSLGLIENNRLSAIVTILATPLNSQLNTGLRADPTCDRDNLLYREFNTNQDFGTQDCWLVDHIWPNNLSAGSGSMAVLVTTGMEPRGIPMPPVLIRSDFYFGDTRGIMRVLYYWNPEVRGISSSSSIGWEDSDWHFNYIKRDLRKVAFVDEVVRWGQQMYPYIRHGFAGDSVAEVNPPPALAGALLTGSEQALGRASGAAACAEEATLRSPRVRNESTTLFRNSTGSPIKLYWLDFDGQRQFRTSLAPDRTATQFTYLGHLFLATDAADRCLQIVPARGIRQTVVFAERP